ncbi:MAG: DNA-binding NtrC family response regulator [Saprospiraceae bacterium]|jgi:DNA-binding NtrC family response regulator
MTTSSKILFVDDEHQALKYFNKALSNDFSVLTADSVASAIEILEQHHHEIAVVITDQKMPKQEGIELLQYTHEHHPSIVRMLTTAFCEIDDAIDAINSVEVFRYIAKPWDLDNLTEVLYQGLRRYQAHQEFTSNASAPKEMLFAELAEDCESWREYASYAYGDVNVYSSGLEALANKYYRKLDKSFGREFEGQHREMVDEVIDANFLNSAVLETITDQEDKGFEEIRGTAKKQLH